MALLDRRQRPGRPEALLAELAQRLEQPVAGLVGVDQLHHRLVDQVDDDACRDAVGGVGRTAHGLGGVEIEAAGERREVGERLLVDGIEQLVGPLDEPRGGCGAADRCSARWPASRAKRWSSRSASASTPIERILAAASSIASGSPSSRRQISADRRRGCGRRAGTRVAPRRRGRRTAARRRRRGPRRRLLGAPARRSGASTWTDSPGKPERLATGGQHGQSRAVPARAAGPGARRRRGRARSCRARSSTGPVVDELLDRPLQREVLALLDVERGWRRAGRWRPGRARRPARRRRPGRSCSAQAAATVIASRVLPTPPGPQIVTIGRLAEHRPHGRDVVGPTDQLRRLTPRQRRPRRASRRAVDDRSKDGSSARICASSVLRRRREAEAQLVAEHRAQLGAPAQRLGLPAGAVEGQHQLAPEPLAERVGGDERFELGHRPAVLAARRAGPR